MSDEDLELLITLDDPEGAPEEDTFHDLSATSDRLASQPAQTVLYRNQVPQTAHVNKNFLRPGSKATHLFKVAPNHSSFSSHEQKKGRSYT